MDAAVIVIEVAPPAPAAEYLSALVQACNRASERAACVLAEHAPADPPLAVAIVKPEGSEVRIELGLRREGGSEWHTRKFEFLPQDEELERWRTVGFAIGTLAQAAREAPPTAPPAAPPSTTEAPTPAPSVPEKPTRKPDTQPPDHDRPAKPGAWLDTAFSAGPALDSGVWRLGGTVRSSLELVPAGPFFTASTLFATSVGDAAWGLDADWLGLGAGAGYALVRSRQGRKLEIRLEALFARFAVNVEDGLGRSDAGHRWLVGTRGGLDVVFPLAGWLGLVACGDVSVTAPTDIRVAGRRVASAPALGYGAGAGLRLSLR